MENPKVTLLEMSMGVSMETLLENLMGTSMGLQKEIP